MLKHIKATAVIRQLVTVEFLYDTMGMNEINGSELANAAYRLRVEGRADGARYMDWSTIKIKETNELEIV